MSVSSLKTPLLLVLLAVVIGGASYYTTDVVQAGEAQRLRDSRRVAELETAQVEDLLQQESVSAEAAEAALSRWYSRYKYIPREMDTADIVEYLESLTRNGFDAFDLRLAGREQTPDFSKYTFEVQGIGRYAALYHLIWHLENNREFYRVHNLRMSYKDALGTEGPPPSGRDLVEFSFQIESFFNGIDGISAPEADLAPLPVGLLLPHNATRDIFAPMVRVPKDAPTTSVAAPSGAEVAASGPPPTPSPRAADAPRSTEPARPTMPEGLDIERATLALILGDKAHFTDEWGRKFEVAVGDEVEGGAIEQVDPRGGTVLARITRDGRERIVTRVLGDQAGR